MTSTAVPENGIRVLALLSGVVMYGAERANLEALNALMEKGARVQLLVSSDPWAEPMRKELAALGYDLAFAPYITPPRPDYPINPLINFPWVIARASLAFLNARRRFRPTHILANTQLNVLSVLPALAVTRTPLVYRCGDKPVTHNRLYSLVWRFIVRRASAFVAVSRFIADKMREHGAPEEALHVVYSRPPARVVTEPFDTALVEPGCFNIMFVGQVNATKGADCLVEAFETVATRHPNARLFIAGRVSDWVGDAWARELRDATLAKPDLAGRVHFLGYLEDVPGLLAHADVVAAPTVTDEPLANVVMEAKKAGAPTVVFRSGGLPEVIEHGVDGFICETRTAQALADALDAYVADPAMAKRQGEAARASLARFGVNEFAERWTAIYRAIQRPGR
ncbi:glycosyltransferase involved in cell wall biosynthesis [Caulobacter ginsengisoli]|uniref:Glycosyltransferase involved in cell wall biosynthesis n=1 Tax=Caulobacter ginsengisoli TaxID=400775 RepID=A0ABU0IM85_9CAUL|nr:glycosyltransferase family 4 protein [Caulobacter ginsengisoli]MDQ0463117.1 glycosyltransferase involved in cell wall biosynthesis [Caulobacter ginsengisoli]